MEIRKLRIIPTLNLKFPSTTNVVSSRMKGKSTENTRNRIRRHILIVIKIKVLFVRITTAPTVCVRTARARQIVLALPLGNIPRQIKLAHKETRSTATLQKVPEEDSKRHRKALGLAHIATKSCRPRCRCHNILKGNHNTKSSNMLRNNVNKSTKRSNVNSNIRLSRNVNSSCTQTSSANTLSSNVNSSSTQNSSANMPSNNVNSSNMLSNNVCNSSKSSSVSSNNVSNSTKSSSVNNSTRNNSVSSSNFWLSNSIKSKNNLARIKQRQFRTNKPQPQARGGRPPLRPFVRRHE
mmetsp:Transcript_33236/g.69225  ORF Transcript_33236/g.69225 Transcript_33236/m.69225 type:complete len:294 (+) Transcript_33236:1751-2632(+)